ncbi:MAG: hypothetical protein ACOC1F_06795 [Myxococcota bacterium]
MRNAHVGSFFAVAVLLAAGCGSDDEPSKLVQPDDAVLLADMDSTAVPWFVVTDGTCEAPESGYTEEFSANGYRGGRGVEVQGGPCTDWGAVLGFYPNRGEPFDASKVAGVRLAVRGSLPSARIRFQCQDTASMPEGKVCSISEGDCFDGAGRDIPVSLAWGTVRVRWDEMTRRGFGPAEPLHPEAIIQCELVFPDNVPFELVVDEVAWIAGETTGQAEPSTIEDDDGKIGIGADDSGLPLDYDACVQGITYFCVCSALAGAECQEGQILDLRSACADTTQDRRDGLLCMNDGEPANQGGCLEVLNFCFDDGGY